MTKEANDNIFIPFNHNEVVCLGSVFNRICTTSQEKSGQKEKDEIKLPISCKYGKPYMAPALSILDHGEEQISNNALRDFHFSPSSLLLDKPSDFNSVLDSGLLSYQKSQFGKHVYKDDDGEIDTNFNHAALSLSHNKHYFKLSKKCKNGISNVQDSIYLPPFHHFSDTEAWFSSSPRCLSLTSSQSNYQSSITRILQLYERENIYSLFHIDDRYEPKINRGGGIIGVVHAGMHWSPTVFAPTK